MPKKYKFQNDASVPREYKFFPYLAWAGYYEQSKNKADYQGYKSFSMPETSRERLIGNYKS